MIPLLEGGRLLGEKKTLRIQKPDLGPFEGERRRRLLKRGANTIQGARESSDIRQSGN